MTTKPDDLVGLPPTHVRLTGKTAVVVGGGQLEGPLLGNGRATAIHMAREGAEVLVVDRDGASADRTVSLIERVGGHASAWAADITDEAACQAIMATAIERMGRIDILHNNVGVFDADQGLDLEVARWDRVLNANARGTWLTCKHAIPAMRRAGGGVIINVTSIASVAGVGIAYSASKGAVNTITRSLAMTNASHGIRVNAVMPGLMDTSTALAGWTDAAGADAVQLLAGRSAHVPLGRLGSAWDVAQAAVFLASDEAAYITGVVLPVDGGMSVSPATGFTTIAAHTDSRSSSDRTS